MTSSRGCRRLLGGGAPMERLGALAVDCTGAFRDRSKRHRIQLRAQPLPAVRFEVEIGGAGG
jgi:hypothetical protein